MMNMVSFKKLDRENHLNDTDLQEGVHDLADTNVEQAVVELDTPATGSSAPDEPKLPFFVV